MSSVILYTLYLIGLKKQAVDLAIKWLATLPIESKKYRTGDAFINWQKKYPICEYCTWPMYPSDSHEYCDEQLQDAAQRAADELLCQSCWDKPAVKDRRCQPCWDFDFLCREGCGKPDSECDGNCYAATLCDATDFWTEAHYDGWDYPDDDEIDDASRHEIEHGRRHEMYNS